MIDGISNCSRYSRYSTARRAVIYGWYARIIVDKVNHSSIFYDDVYGSPGKALVAAEAWLAAARELRKVPNRIRPNPPYLTKRSRHPTKTGVVGVVSIRDHSRGGITRYKAHWVDPETGKSMSKSYSVMKYGSTTALRMATEVREEAIRKIKKYYGMK